MVVCGEKLAIFSNLDLDFLEALVIHIGLLGVLTVAVCLRPVVFQLQQVVMRKELCVDLVQQTCVCLCVGWHGWTFVGFLYLLLSYYISDRLWRLVSLFASLKFTLFNVYDLTLTTLKNCLKIMPDSFQAPQIISIRLITHLLSASFSSSILSNSSSHPFIPREPLVLPTTATEISTSALTYCTYEIKTKSKAQFSFLQNPCLTDTFPEWNCGCSGTYQESSEKTCKNQTYFWSAPCAMGANVWQNTSTAASNPRPT